MNYYKSSLLPRIDHLYNELPKKPFFFKYKQGPFIVFLNICSNTTVIADPDITSFLSNII